MQRHDACHSLSARSRTRFVCFGDVSFHVSTLTNGTACMSLTTLHIGRSWSAKPVFIHVCRPAQINPHHENPIEKDNQVRHRTATICRSLQARHVSHPRVKNPRPLETANLSPESFIGFKTKDWLFPSPQTSGIERYPPLHLYPHSYQSSHHPSIHRLVNKAASRPRVQGSTATLLAVHRYRSL